MDFLFGEESNSVSGTEMIDTVKAQMTVFDSLKEIGVFKDIERKHIELIKELSEGQNGKKINLLSNNCIINIIQMRNRHCINYFTSIGVYDITCVHIAYMFTVNQHFHLITLFNYLYCF